MHEDEEKVCPYCEGKEFTKDGTTKRKQRYLCKGCKKRITRFTKRGCSEEKKLLALKMYIEGVGFRGIARVLNVSNVAVLKWIRKFEKDLPVPN